MTKLSRRPSIQALPARVQYFQEGQLLTTLHQVRKTGLIVTLRTQVQLQHQWFISGGYGPNDTLKMEVYRHTYPHALNQEANLLHQRILLDLLLFLFLGSKWVIAPLADLHVHDAWLVEFACHILQF